MLQQQIAKDILIEDQVLIWGNTSTADTSVTQLLSRMSSGSLSEKSLFADWSLRRIEILISCQF
jgi:hypothetical protein